MPNSFSLPPRTASLVVDFEPSATADDSLIVASPQSIRERLIRLAAPPAGYVAGELTTVTFAEAVLPQENLLVGWNRATGRTRFYSSAGELAMEQQGKPDVYFAIPSYRPEAREKNKRTADYVAAFNSLFADIDAGPVKFEKHGNKVYVTTEEAYLAIVAACNSRAIPTPSVLVASGHGFHLWYVLPEAVSLDVWKRYQHALVATFLEAGVKIDEAAQSPVQLARLPGTVHAGTGRRVEVIWFEAQEAA